MKWIGNYHEGDATEGEKKRAAGYVKGEPKATPKFTVEQLKSMGYVGLYEDKPE